MRKIFLILTGIIIVMFTITYVTGYSLVLGNSNKTKNYNFTCSNGVVNPFKNFNFNRGDDWKIYIVFENEEVLRLPKEMNRTNYLSTSDIDLLNEIKNTWSFKCTDGDMATVNSKIALLKNNNVVFESGIVVNENMQGLQSRSFGWAESNNLIKELKKFKRSYSPIIFL